MKKTLKNQNKNPPNSEKDQICCYWRQGVGEGKLEKGGLKVQTSNYKINIY